MIALAMPSVAKTRIGDRTFGRICLRTMRCCVVRAGDDYELAFLQCRDIAAHGTLQGCHCDAASTREDELAWPRALRGAGRLGGAGFAVPEPCKPCLGALAGSTPAGRTGSGVIQVADGSAMDRSGMPGGGPEADLPAPAPLRSATPGPFRSEGGARAEERARRCAFRALRPP